MEPTKDKYVEKLLSLGLTEDDVAALLEQLTQDVSNSFLYESIVSNEESEIDGLAIQLESLPEEERAAKFAEIYTEKTGKTPVQRADEILDRYLAFMIGAIESYRKLGEKLKDAKRSTVKKLMSVIESGNWEDVKPVLDELGMKEEDLFFKV